MQPIDKDIESGEEEEEKKKSTPDKEDYVLSAFTYKRVRALLFVHVELFVHVGRRWPSQFVSDGLEIRSQGSRSVMKGHTLLGEFNE